VLFLNLSGLITGALYSLKRFSLPAFTAAAFNATIVLVAIIRPEHINSLAWGVLLGSIVQVLLQLPGLKFKQLRWHWNLQHPALRRILQLYVPIVLGVVVSYVAIAISYNLATSTGDENVAIMRFATTLIQFPLGLVATAVSVAILPTLAEQATSPEKDRQFKATLAQGLNLVLILIIPATVGLFLLATPIVALAFERGDWLPAATQETSIVLRYYLLGLPFAAVDQVLIFAFYARKNTLTPALVGVLSVGVYLAVAVLLIRPLGLYSLMIADSVKHMSHAGVMALLLHRRMGGVKDGILATTIKASVASVLMGAAVWGICQVLPASPDLLSRIILVAGGGGLGILVYGLVMGQLRVPAADLLWSLLISRLRRTT
jgi:putative peptidoglycan lipid II flippase